MIKGSQKVKTLARSEVIPHVHAHEMSLTDLMASDLYLFSSLNNVNSICSAIRCILYLVSVVFA